MKLLITLLMLSGFTHVSATTYERNIRVHSEMEGEDRASGIAIMGSATDQDDPLMFRMGLSFNSVTSDRPVESNQDKHINPAYMFMNMGMNSRVSPFVEFGFDLGDSFIDKVFHLDGEYIDYYYSYGLVTRLTKQFSIEAYQKIYRLKYYELLPVGKQTTELKMLGIGFSYHF